MSDRGAGLNAVTLGSDAATGVKRKPWEHGLINSDDLAAMIEAARIEEAHSAQASTREDDEVEGQHLSGWAAMMVLALLAIVAIVAFVMFGVAMYEAVGRLPSAPSRPAPRVVAVDPSAAKSPAPPVTSAPVDYGDPYMGPEPPYPEPPYPEELEPEQDNMDAYP